MRPFPKPISIYLLEGSNSFATAYYFNYLLFLLRDRHGFGDGQNLALGAAHGLLFMVSAWIGGRLGQRLGYVMAIRLGFAGMAASLLLGWMVPGLVVQMVAFAGWTITMCFTWPNLEALASAGQASGQLARRVGIYNVVWAGTAALGYFMGGWLVTVLGSASLYWLPMGIHAIQAIATLQWPGNPTAPVPAADILEKPADTRVARPAYFQKLAWMANPLSYMAINTLLVMVPGISTRLGLGTAEIGALMSIWYFTRTGAFAVLWLWHGWHYRFSWFGWGYVLLVTSFACLMISGSIPVLIAAQFAFGWATALLYYSSLFYSMDGSETHGVHGGIHEALVGMGIGGGPAISVAATWLSGNPSAPAWAVTSLLGVGGAMLLHSRWRGREAATLPG